MQEAIRAISELVLALGGDAEANSDDRIVAVARLIARRGFTAEEVRRSADHLARDRDFGRQVSRFKKAIIAQDFEEAREATAPPPPPHWKQQGFESQDAWLANAEEASEAWRRQLPQARVILAEATSPKVLPPVRDSTRGVAEEVPVGPKCPKHDRELIDGEFCAACAIDEAMEMHRRGVRPAEAFRDVPEEDAE